ncbi:unnamed protein product [Strongylus vulgaris]|uniref:Uncharacterized protein n=1 Tax=Strongylus vulgaris TaxID=40348 RepID=A0A3P7IXN5_STRVU|nr:unnamed protein product [Strongylus vulgaris]
MLVLDELVEYAILVVLVQGSVVIAVVVDERVVFAILVLTLGDVEGPLVVDKRVVSRFLVVLALGSMVGCFVVIN